MRSSAPFLGLGLALLVLVNACSASRYYKSSATAQDFVRFKGFKCSGAARGSLRTAILRDVQNREVCTQLCAKDTRCHVATYHIGTETCRTYSTCVAYDRADGYATAVLERLNRKVLGRFWTLVKGEGCVRDPSSDCMEVIIDSGLKESHRECKEACQEEETCEAVNFLKTSGLCQLLRQQTAQERRDEINANRVVVGVVVPQHFNPAVVQRKIVNDQQKAP